ncbi:ubiquitin carboxyl-terminal hydrolase 21-like isoform X1 [Iris pallida]|uniref:Ubiquitin carboxyl-terminal hydrolase n=1 Tax=Iris pallida TaxID=29817 RepID=A0AAX6EK79_IRIPA|nr:ubiquitin carboxyl-terminal hydrolase 21-like isoform X1 [Iris pallida]
MEIDSISSPTPKFRPDREEKEEGCFIGPLPRSDELGLSWNETDNDRVGAGFWNNGNTCYLNAVLQCTVHTVPLVEKLRSLQKTHSCDGEENNYFCSLCALRHLVDECIENSGRAISPNVFINNLRKISNYFQLGQQEDAHEFLHCLLDSLHNCCLDPSTKDKPLAMNEDSLVKHVYGGRLISQLRCSECGHCSNTSEPLLDLSLDIADADSLINALESFTKIESIEETKFTCEGCKAKVLMEKQTKIDQAPEVISLHLKRFENDGLFIQKIDKSVDYPLELDLKPFLCCPKDDEQTMYDLYAVLVHIGGAYCGHYYCCVRSSPTTWHSMDDSKVNTVSEAEVLNEKAYILFYIKKGSSPWFSSLMDLHKMENSPLSVLDRRLFPSSLEETSSSTETPERDDEGPTSPHNDVSHDSITSQPGTYCSLTTERDHSLHSCPLNSTGHQPGTQPTKRTSPNHISIDVLFDGDSSEEEKENTIPQVNVAPEAKKVDQEGEAAPVAAKSVDPSLTRLLRGLPNSRRSGLMSCLPPSSKPVGKRASLATGRQAFEKRRKGFSEVNSSDGEGGHCRQPTRVRQQLTTASSKSLSPRSLKRGLFRV